MRDQERLLIKGSAVAETIQICLKSTFTSLSCKVNTDEKGSISVTAIINKPVVKQH